MLLERLPIQCRGQGFQQRCAKLMRRGLADARHRPGKGFLDDPLRCHGNAENSARDIGNGNLPFLLRVAARHRRAGANAQQVRIAAAFAQPADQQRHVGALPAAVGVELVQYDELERRLALIDERKLVRPCQHQLQHHVVRQENVGRVLLQLLPPLLFLLAGIAGGGDQALFGW